MPLSVSWPCGVLLNFVDVVSSFSSQVTVSPPLDLVGDWFWALELDEEGMNYPLLCSVEACFQRFCPELNIWFFGHVEVITGHLMHLQSPSNQSAPVELMITGTRFTFEENDPPGLGLRYIL